MEEFKQRVITEIDGRIDRLKDHHKIGVPKTGNKYEELNMAVSRILNEALTAELSNLKETLRQM